MALLTGGTNATSSLSAALFNRQMSTANIALIANGILNDQNVAHPIYPGAFAQTGLLHVPNRGILQCLPGDYVMFDATTGWPILLSAYAIASGPWTHS
jgi:hypothetical protein